MPQRKIRFAEFELDFGRFQLARGGNPVRLEGLPLQLLMFLVENRGKLVTREQIADELWGRDVFVDIEQGINTAIRKVRIAINDDSGQPQYLQTVVGRGYRFVAPTSADPEIAAHSLENHDAFTITAEEFGQAIMAAAGVHPEDSQESWKGARLISRCEANFKDIRTLGMQLLKDVNNPLNQQPHSSCKFRYTISIEFRNRESIIP